MRANRRGRGACARLESVPRSAATSSASASKDRFAGIVRNDFAERDQHEHGQDDGGDAAVVEHRHLPEEYEPEAAGADESHNRRAPDVDVPFEDNRAEDHG